MAYAAAAGWNGTGFDRVWTTGADGSGKSGVPETATDTGGYDEINSAATTAVKETGGILHKIVIGMPLAGTITIYDIGGADCTGTPVSGKLGVIT